MFRIEAFCDDKNLPRVLHALMGLVHGQPAIQPVANAKVEKGKVRAKSNGELGMMFMEHLKASKIDSVVAADIKEFAAKHGYSPTSYSHFLGTWVRDKLLKKNPKTKGNKITYMVVK